MIRITFFCVFFLLSLLTINNTSAQVAVNATGAAADGSAMLDIASTTRGLLAPRMTTAQREAISSPAAGLLVYQTDAPVGFYYYNGTEWFAIAAGTPVGTGGTANYIQLSMSAHQGPGVVNGDKVVFNTTVKSNGMTSTNNGINLKAGVTYRLEARIAFNASTSPNYLGYCIANAGGAVSEAAYAMSPISTTWDSDRNGIILIYTPTVDENVWVKITDQSIGTGVIRSDFYPYFIATEMSVSTTSTSGGTPVGTGGNANYIKLIMNAVQNGVTTNTTINFNTVAVANGMTNTGNGVNLKAGKTYRLEASININGNSGLAYLGYQFHNGTTAFGEGAFTNQSNSPGAYGFKSGLLEFYTPATDVTVSVIAVDANNSSTLDGIVTPAFNTYLIATEMTSGTSGGGSQWTTTGSDISYSTGNVGIGTIPTAGYKLKLAGGMIRSDLGSTGASLVLVGGGSNIQIQHNAAAEVYIVNSANGQYVFTGPSGIGTYGNLYAAAFSSSSDRRLKNNIVNTHFGINDLMRIQVRDYVYKADASNTLTTGFIAQELYEIFPNAVTRPANEEDMWSVDYGKVTPLLVKAVQDLNIKIEALEAENAELRSQATEIESLKAEVEAIKAQLNLGTTPQARQ